MNGVTKAQSLAAAVHEAVEATRLLPIGAGVTACDFGRIRDDQTGGWWWYVTAQQYHRLGNGTPTQDRDQTAANVRCVIDQGLLVSVADSDDMRQQVERDASAEAQDWAVASQEGADKP